MAYRSLDASKIVDTAERLARRIVVSVQGFSDARSVISAAEIETRLASYKQTAQFDRQLVGSA